MTPVNQVNERSFVIGEIGAHHVQESEDHHRFSAQAVQIPHQVAKGTSLMISKIEVARRART
jgi:hypothetical protein